MVLAVVVIVHYQIDTVGIFFFTMFRKYQVFVQQGETKHGLSVC